MLAVQEQEHAGEQSRMRALSNEALLQQLPMLQRLMSRLVNCKPTGTACQDHVVQVIRLPRYHQASFSLKAWAMSAL